MRIRLNVRFIVPLVVLALLAVANYGLLARVTDQLEADAAVAELAARQRMLTVQVAYSVDHIAMPRAHEAPPAAFRDSLRTLTAELTRAHHRLTAAHAPHAAVDDATARLDARMQEFLLHARALVAGTPPALDADNRHYRWIDSNWEPILGLLEAAVADHQREASASVERLRTMQRATLTASLIAMLAIALGVFRPVARTLDRTLRGQETIARALAQERNFVDTVLDTAGALVIVVDRAGNVVRFNRAAEALTGRSEDEMVGLPVWQVLPAEDREPAHKVFAEILAGHYPVSFENHWLDREGNAHLVAWSNTALLDAGGHVEFVVATGLDITDRAELEARLRHLANFDTLTGLPNRALFNDRLAQAISQAKRKQWNFCLMLLDLDRFKQVNDTLGHQTGDELLQEAAERLRGCVRASDTVARLGGDEFTVLLQDVRQRSDVDTIATKIVAAMNAPFTLAGQTQQISTSVGIAFYPEGGDDAVGLLKNADIAMYAAKHGGGSRYCFFDVAGEAVCTRVREAANGVELPRELRER